MDMGPAGFFKKPGKQKVVCPEYRPADGADPAAAPFKAVYAAGNVHKPVRPAHGRKHRRFNPFPPFQPGGTNRTGPGRAGKTFPGGLFFPVLSPRHGHGKTAGKGKKQGKAKPQKNHSPQG
jgi:hypothetical protein